MNGNDKQKISSSRFLIWSAYSLLLLAALFMVFYQPADAQVDPNGTLPPIEKPSFQMSIQPQTVNTTETVQFTVTYATSPTVGAWTASFVLSNPIPADLTLVTTTVVNQSGGQLTVTNDLITWKVDFSTAQRQQYTLTYSALANIRCVTSNPVENKAYLVEIANGQVVTPAELPLVITQTLNISSPIAGCNLMPLIVRQPNPSLKPLVNGGFDAEPKGAGWQQVNGPLIYRGQSVSVATQTPPNFAWLGGVADQVNALTQTIDLPFDYDVQVKFYYRIVSLEKQCTNSEYFRVLLDSQELQLKQLCSDNNTPGTTWQLSTVSLAPNSTAFPYEARVLRFETQLNSKDNSNFFLDSVSLCSDDTAAPAGTPKCN